MAFSPLIYGDKVSNVSISGNATLDGSGEKWWNYWRHLRAEHKQTGHWNTNSKWQEQCHRVNADLIKHSKEFMDDSNDLIHCFLRPQFFQTTHSDHITLEGLTLINSPFWTVTPVFTDYIKIDKLTIKNPSNAPNTDGIDPDSCRFVTISNCFIDVGDDCVCIKSGKDKQVIKLNCCFNFDNSF